MAWFYSPRDKRKYKIVKVEDRSFFNIPSKCKAKFYRVYYDTGSGVDYTQVDTRDAVLSDGKKNPILLGVQSFLSENKKTNSNFKTQSFSKKYNWKFQNKHLNKCK